MRLILIISMLSTLLSVHTTQAQPNGDSYRFAYFAFTTENVGEINTVNSEGTNLDTVNIVAPEGYEYPTYSTTAYPSPDGQWVALLLQTQNPNDFSTGLFLFNTATGSHRLLDVVLPIPTYQLEWSPNSSHVAITTPRTTNGLAQLFIYSILDQSRLTLTPAGFSQTAFGWSNSGVEIAALTWSCVDNPCQSYLEIYDIETQSRQNQITLSGRIDYPISACEVRWSSNLRYIGFVAQCDGQLPSVPTDVYIWDTEGSSLTQITDFTGSIGSGIVNGRYRLLWVDSDNLLISADYVANRQSNVSILVWNVEDRLLTPLLPYAVERWIPNLQGTLIAYRAYVFQEFQQEYTHTAISTYNNQRFEEIALLPLGCDLSWSSNSQMLAFTQRGEDSTNCLEGINSIRLYDTVTQTSFEHNDLTGNVVLIGWINS